MRSWAEDHMKTTMGPLATIRTCTVKGCGFSAKVKRGALNVGRGYGMREGNKARSKVINHIKSAHPELKPHPTPSQYGAEEEKV